MLELDEPWASVSRRKDKRWVWLAQCRRTRQIVAYAVGSRGVAPCRILHQRLARFVRRARSFSGNDAMHDNCLRLFLHEYNRPAKHQPKRLRLI